MSTGRPQAGGVIENPATGERILLRRTAAQTGGELLEFELHLSPGGHVPAGHRHPEQEERFKVLEGEARFRLGRRHLIAREGETVTVPPGTPHSFSNPGPGPARLLVQARPALRMEELLETAAGLGLRPGPLELAKFLVEFEREVRSPFAPRLVGALVRPLAWLARRGGGEAVRRRRSGSKTSG